ncbi:ParB/RepB/Spo0J family partition protein [Polaromonas naphthalenivorans]|uniref:ParB-like partition proteins n=1 Tax=Polaromonas naphthalenivorans (strain CJ2) TaxID=365044 RepID=A1VWG9_POLNA|nr:ParB/RepB/Spo0J family partition protein [Polaromonas naphthalenivorans]ABM39997.1 parB-like partition proteins [Polaromonas naphthalenivorans CJ2]
MAKLPPKLSGLVSIGAVVASTPVHELPDMPILDAFSETSEPVAILAPSVVPTAFNSGRNLQSINIHLIDPNPLAPREVYTPQMILSRADDLRVQGQHDPIHVIPNPDASGRFIICDGWTRVLACREHKVFDSLLAEIHNELSLEESAWFGYEQNECRAMHCDLDRAMFYEKLIAAGEPAVEIARRAKLSKTMMSFYRAYAKLPEDVMEIIRQNPGKFGANAAYQLHKLHEKCGIRKAVALAGKYAVEDQTVRWLTNQAQALLSPTASKSIAPSKQIRYSNGYYKQRGDIFEVSIAVPDDKRVAFSIALEKLLDTVAEVLPAESDTAESSAQ